MPNPLKTKKTVVLAKVESAYGEDPTLVASENAIEALEITVPKITADMKERNPGNSDLSMHPQVRGKTSFEFSISTFLRGSGTAGTAPRTSPLLKACGFEETIVSATSVTYTPRSSGFESCAVETYIDGILMQILGCVGDYELDLTAGEFAKETYNLKGQYALPTDSVIVDPTFDTTVPQIVKGITMTVGGYSAVIEKLTIKMGNQVADRPDFNQAEGSLFAITGRNPEGTMTIEAVLRATSNADFLSYFHNQTAKDVSFVIGATAGNIGTITLPKIYFKAPEYADRDGVRTNELAFQIARNAGDDEVVIAHT